MTERKRPDFSLEAGIWLKQNFLSDQTRQELSNVFLSNSGKRIKPTLQNRLINFANDFLQYRVERDEPTSVIRGQLAQVAMKADELLQLMESLRQSTINELNAHAGDAASAAQLPHDDDQGDGEPMPPSIEPEIAYRIARVDEARFLDAVWDHLSALEAIANAAKVTVERASMEAESDEEERSLDGKLSRQDKPDEIEARWLVAELARHYMQLTSVVVPAGSTISRFGDVWPEGIRVPGKPPPKNPAGWFAQFVGVLGSKTGTEIGERLVKSGIDLAQKRTQAQRR